MDRYKVDRKDRFLLSSTSKGNQIKWFKDNKWLKADTMGYEGVAEALVSNLEMFVENIDFVEYSLCVIDDYNDGEYINSYNGCVSDNFTNEDESVISVDRILTQYYRTARYADTITKLSGKDLVSTVVNICSEITRISYNDIMLYLSNMFKLDAVTLNEDRHLNNISFVKNINGTYRLAPIFDNGLSLLSDTQDYPMGYNLKSNMRKVKSKPFSSSFKKQIGYFDEYPLLRIDVKSFFEKIESVSSEDRTREFNRAYYILKLRLEELKGVAWEDV